MNEPGLELLLLRLKEVEYRLARRDGMITRVYGFLFLAAFALFALFPFPLSRIGSVVLMIGFGYMIWRCVTAGQAQLAQAGAAGAWWNRELARLDEQIQLAQSMLFNVPFFVGANLFWMGLPGMGTTLQKGLVDLAFLGMTTALFAASYAFTQRWIRKELLPLREELERLSERGAIRNP